MNRAALALAAALTRAASVRKTPASITEHLRGVDFDQIMRPASEDRISLEELEGVDLSDLLTDPGRKIDATEDFSDAMLRAVKDLNQNPELLKEVSQRIS